MKFIISFILASLLFTGLSYQGKAFFGMGDDMQMGDLECVNHCIDQTVVPAVAASALPVLLFSIVFSVVYFASFRRQEESPRMHRVFHRLTEPIRLLLLSQTLSPVIIRD